MQQDNIPSWFASEMQQPSPMPPSLSKRRWIFKLSAIVIGILLLFGGGATIVHLLRPVCLTNADYQQLTGVPYEGQIDPTSAFYTTLIHFQTDKSTYDNASQEVSTVRSLADFYKSHPHASIIFTLSATYSEDRYQELTKQRLSAAKQSLASFGVPQDSISVVAPKKIIPEEAFTENDAANTYNSITASISSQEGCR